MQFISKFRFIMQKNIMNPCHYIRAAAYTAPFGVLYDYYYLFRQSSKDARKETYELVGIALTNVQHKQDTLLCCLACPVCAAHHETLKTQITVLCGQCLEPHK